MSLFDPNTVNKQIDSYLASVPPGKRLVLIGNANLSTKTASAALMIKVTDNIGAYVRVGKAVGKPTDADAGFKISFLAEPVPEFTYSEIVAILKDRGLGWVRSHIYAYRLVQGGTVEL